MTPEEQIAATQAAQEASRVSEFKRESRVNALRTAKDMKPQPVYSGKLLQQVMPTMPHYDLLKEAETIYQWLINE
jgi:hypothetical protein